MNKWLRQLRLECRLLFGNKVLLALPLLFGAWMASALSKIAPPMSQDLYMYTYDFHKIQHTLSLGVAMLLGILIVRRDLRRPAFEWSGALPVSAAVFVTAKAAAGLLYLSLFTAAMNIVYASFAIHQGLPEDAVTGELLFFTVQYEWSYLITLILAMFLGLAIPGRVAYLIGFCGWVFGTFFLDVFIINRMGWYFLKAFHLSQLTLSSIYENQVWGPWISGEELTRSRLFTAAFALMLIVFSITMLKKARPSRTARSWVVLCGVMLIVTAAAYIPYGIIWKERYDALAQIRETTPAYEEVIEGKLRATRFIIDSYEIEVKQNTDDTLSFTTVMKLPTSGLPLLGKVPFTLQSSYAINAIKVNGAAVPYVRKGEIVELDGAAFDPKLPEQELTMAYDGKVFDWNAVEQKEAVDSFVKGDLVYLPSGAAWYPFPGNQYTFVISGGNMSHYPDRSLVKKADFRISLEDFQGNVYGTITKTGSTQNRQSFGQAGVEGVSLFAGHFIELTTPATALRLITSPGNRREGERFLQGIAEEIAYYKSWLPHAEGAIDTIFYFSTEQMSSARNPRLIEVNGGTLSIGETKSHNLDYIQTAVTENAWLFGDTDYSSSFTREKGPAFSLAAEIRKAIRYMYLLDHEHMKPEQLSRNFMLRSLYRPSAAQIGKGDEREALFAMIEKAAADGKTEQVKQVLRAFYEKGLRYESTKVNEPVAYPIITMDDWQREWKRVFGS